MTAVTRRVTQVSGIGSVTRDSQRASPAWPCYLVCSDSCLHQHMYRQHGAKCMQNGLARGFYLLIINLHHVEAAKQLFPICHTICNGMDYDH